MPTVPLRTLFGAIPISLKLRAVSDDPLLVPHHPICDSPHTTASEPPSPLESQGSLFMSITYLTGPSAVRADFPVSP